MITRHLTPPWVTTWNDLNVDLVSASEVGAHSPHRVIYKNDGNVALNYAIQLNGTNQYGKADYYSALNTSSGNYTIETWTKPLGDLGTILYRENYFKVSKSYDSLVVSIANSWDIWISNIFLLNSPTHIVITVEKSGTRSKVNIYVNGALKTSRTLWGYTLGTETTDLYVGTEENTDYYNGVIDTTTLYNVVLTDDQVLERYNNGQGTETLPTGITESTDVIANFNFNENTGSTVDNYCTLGDDHDLTLYNSPTWVEGILSSSKGSVGVLAWSFSKNIPNELFFSRQLPHTYKEGTTIRAHIHWVNPTTKTGNVYWGLEYTWANIDNTFSNTAIDYAALPAGNQDEHKATTIVEIPGTGKKISSLLICRLFRDPTNSLDTFDDNIYLLEFDFHYQSDFFGSISEWIKWE